MKKADVQVGTTYVVKVAGNLVPVKITREHPNGGWEGRSEKTGKTIRVKSPQRLRRMVSERPQQRKKIVSLAEYEAMADDANPAARGATSAPATTVATAAARRDTGEPVATGGKPRGKLSLLNAAAIVLKASGEPMTCSQIVQQAAETTDWQPGSGLTPANTLSAAMRREIKTKGDASRFRLADRGRFAMADQT